MQGIDRVIIIGGGPAGILAALRLKQENHISSVIYEARPEPTTLGGAIGIPSNGLRLLHRLGLYEKVAAKGAETPNIILRSIKGNVMGKMDMSSWAKRRTGFGYVRIRRTDIMDVLLAAAKEACIPVHYGKRLVGLQDGNAQITATFSDDTQDTADFLLGCDGIHSSVRRLYVDPECTPEYSGISNMFSLISTSDLERSSLPIDDLNATLTSNGMLGISPANPAHNVLYWFFSHEVPIPKTGDVRDGWEEQGKNEIEQLKLNLLALLGDESSEWTGFLRDVLHKTDVIKFYPIYKVPTGRPWFKGRCLVIGDAAHAMPPHASQGVSMALEDVFLLSKLFKSSFSSLENALTSYERKRKARTEAMLKTAEKNGTLRNKKSAWHLWVNEVAISGFLWIYQTTGLANLGLGQKPLAYDVEEESFDP